MEFKNLQDVLECRREHFGEADAIETIAHAARVHDSRRVRSFLVNLLAFGETAVYCGDPSTPTEFCTDDIRGAREAYEFLYDLGLEHEYTNRDEFTFHLEREC